MRTIGLCVTAVMLVTLGYGLTAGDLSGEGAQILDLAWGRVSLVDIYTGVSVLGCWIIWRERSLSKAFPWLALLVIGGNFAIGPYLIWISRTGKPTSELLAGQSRQ